MNKKITIIAAIIIILVAAAFFFAYLINRKSVGKVNDFEQCAKLGFPVMESYPRQCKADSKTFVEEINANISNNSASIVISPDCKIAGCSGQLCVDKNAEDVITTCEYRPEYGCYKNARCEKQTDGQCSWTQTAELSECISQFKT